MNFFNDRIRRGKTLQIDFLDICFLNYAQILSCHLKKIFKILFYFQLCEGLTFLHDSAKLLHRNLSPDSIVLNEAGAWKIFGFDFCLSNQSIANEIPKWRCNQMVESCEDLMPDLDFLGKHTNQFCLTLSKFCIN